MGRHIFKSMGLVSKQDVERDGCLHTLGDVQNKAHMKHPE